jgi:hypothetical protein
MSIDCAHRKNQQTKFEYLTLTFTHSPTLPIEKLGFELVSYAVQCTHRHPADS